MKYRLGVVDVTFWRVPRAASASACRGPRLRAHRRARHRRSVVARAADRLPDRVPQAAARLVRDAGADRRRRHVGRRGAVVAALARRAARAVGRRRRATRSRRCARCRRRCPGCGCSSTPGHVADWGGDPLELLEHADHVQLRQGCPGHAQLHVDDPRRRRRLRRGAAPPRRARLPGHASRSSTSTSPSTAGRLDDPIAWAVDLRTHLLR